MVAELQSGVDSHTYVVLMGLIPIVDVGSHPVLNLGRSPEPVAAAGIGDRNWKSAGTYRFIVGARSGLEGGQGYDGDAVVGLVAVAECGEHDEAGWFSAPGGVDL